jgi:hypothetical protein
VVIKRLTGSRAAVGLPGVFPANIGMSRRRIIKQLAQAQAIPRSTAAGHAAYPIFYRDKPGPLVYG